MIRAAIDVGSHSAKLTIAQHTSEGWLPVVERVEITRLGRGEPQVDGLDLDARLRTLAVLQDFTELLRQHDATDVAAAGTAVLRNAPDAPAFVAEVGATTGLSLTVIAGAEEARLTYLGAVASLAPVPPGQIQLAFDVGGASTELAWGGGLVPDDRRSLDVGTIALAQGFGLEDAVAADRFQAAVAAVTAMLTDLPAVPSPARLVGIGATPATLLALHRGRDIADSHEVHGALLDRPIVAVQAERLCGLDAVDRRLLPGLHPDRATVVLAGAAIVTAVAARWPEAPLILSGRGLRAGLLHDRFDPRR